jgi:sulfofructose kinase
MTVRVDVLCAGHAAYDVTFVVDHHPGADEKCSAGGQSMAGGGPAANAAVTVARLGGTSAFCGYLGRDVFGDLHFQELVNEGVLTDWIVRGPHPTPLSMILVKPDGKRAVVNFKGETPPLESSQVDFSAIAPRSILMDGHEPEISLVLAREARSRGIPTVLDAGSLHSGTERLAGLVDHLIASARFAREFTSERDMCRALRSLRHAAPLAAITLGEDGLIWSHGGREQSWPALPVEVVDTTGAGDVFHGAFALEIARGRAIESALLTARAAAALSCTRLGARPSIPDRAALEGLLHSGSGGRGLVRPPAQVG